MASATSSSAYAVASGEMEIDAARAVVGIFEDAYARSTAWRKNKGVSADEVARNIELAPVGAGAGTQESR